MKPARQICLAGFFMARKLFSAGGTPRFLFQFPEQCRQYLANVVFVACGVKITVMGSCFSGGYAVLYCRRGQWMCCHPHSRIHPCNLECQRSGAVSGHDFLFPAKGVLPQSCRCCIVCRRFVRIRASHRRQAKNERIEIAGTFFQFCHRTVCGQRYPRIGLYVP